LFSANSCPFTSESSNGGAQTWVSTVGDLGGNPVIGATNIYVGASADSSDYNLYALNRDGTLAWKFHTRAVIHASLPLAWTAQFSPCRPTATCMQLTRMGALNWKFAMPRRVVSDTGSYASAPAIGPVSNGGGLLDYDVYFGDNCGDVFVLTASGAVQNSHFAVVAGFLLLLSRPTAQLRRSI
jgi:outer membrane protein assembly factor BamB